MTVTLTSRHDVERLAKHDRNHATISTDTCYYCYYIKTTSR